MTVVPDEVATVEFEALRIPLPEEELQARFETLQRKLVSQWGLIEGFTDEPYGIVVVPSLSGIVRRRSSEIPSGSASRRK